MALQEKSREDQYKRSVQRKLTNIVTETVWVSIFFSISSMFLRLVPNVVIYYKSSVLKLGIRRSRPMESLNVAPSVDLS